MPTAAPNSAGIRLVNVSSQQTKPDTMQCPACKRQMVKIFLTQACDHCDYGVPKDRLHHGFIVYRPRAEGESSTEEYVFRTHADAERWREAAGREGCAIVDVYSLSPFRWHLSRGTLRDVVLADHMFEVFENWKYEALPHRCFLGSAFGDASP